uniref:Major facilitator superfamily (MFS) profile domain-containing protein n=1 Tax=Plectus sambesii TaxID=2011161 RepID=A0A914V1G2_9BILA
MENRRWSSEEVLVELDPDTTSTSGLCCFKHKTRFLILVLTTLCLTSVLSNILTFNFTVICMVDTPKIVKNDSGRANTTTPFDGFSKTMTEEQNDTLNVGFASMLTKFMPHDAATAHIYASEPETAAEEEKEEGLLTTIMKNYGSHDVAQKKFHWSSTKKSYFFSAIAVGALLAAFPVTVMIAYAGAKKALLTVGLITTVATALCPFAVDTGDHFFIIARLLQGVALAACMPVIGCLTSAWASLDENGLFMGIATSFIQLAPVFTMPLSGALCVSDIGWPGVFYVHAAVSLCLFGLWAIFYTDSPADSRWIGDKELRRINEGKVCLLLKKVSDTAGEQSIVIAAIDAKADKPVSTVPYGAIVRTPAVWAVWVATLANFLGVYLVILFSATFLNKKLQYSVADTGVLAAIPTFIQFAVKVTVGPASDKIKCLSDTAKVKLGNSVAFLCMGAALIALYYIPFGNREQSLVMLITAASICGFNVAGFFKSATLVSRHHSHFVMSVSQMLMCVCMLVVPLIVQFMAPNNSDEEWHNVFVIHGGFLVIGNVFFCIFGSGEPAAWALESWNLKKKPTRFSVGEDAPSG